MSDEIKDKDGLEEGKSPDLENSSNEETLDENSSKEEHSD